MTKITKFIEEKKKELKSSMPNKILSALEYRGFYDCGKYLDDDIWDSIMPDIEKSLLELSDKIDENSFTGRCSFCNEENDCRSNGSGMWLCLPCARMQGKVWKKSMK